LPRKKKSATPENQKQATRFAPQFSIRYLQVNQLGAILSNQPIETNLALKYIALVSVPKQSERKILPAAHPSRNWLELHIQEPEQTSKKGGKGGSESKIHVGDVEILSQDKDRKDFDLMLDGVLYGPFVKIRITPATDANENVYSVPIMTFLPIETGHFLS